MNHVHVAITSPNIDTADEHATHEGNKMSDVEAESDPELLAARDLEQNAVHSPSMLTTPALHCTHSNFASEVSGECPEVTNGPPNLPDIKETSSSPAVSALTPILIKFCSNYVCT
jgi:hypothetical protein